MSRAVIKAFSYAEIADTKARDFLQDAEEYWHKQDDLIHDAQCRKGKVLEEIKKTMPGHYARFVTSRLGISVDTADNLILIAQNMPRVPEGTDRLWTVRTKALIARKATSEETRQLLLDKAAAGSVPDEAEATIFVKAPGYLRARYERGTISKEQAAAATKALLSKSVPKPCLEKLIEWNASHAAVIEYIVEAYKDWINTRNKPHPRVTWLDIVEDEGILNGYEWAKPVWDANVSDLEIYKAHRQMMHLEKAAELFDWLVVDSSLVERLPDGRLAAILPEDFDTYTGRNVKLQARVPRKDVKR
jgi:hypothetical protein